MDPLYPARAAATDVATRPTRRGVSVRLGTTGGAAARNDAPSAAIVGICAPDSPWLADLYPGSLVKATRHRDTSHSVEHVRLNSRDSAEGLPGLEGPHRSRIRDALRLALSVGAPSIDLVLARVGGAEPWEFGRLEVHEALDPFLSELTGAVLVYPDMGGPIAVGPGTSRPMRGRVDALLEGARYGRERWAERYQVALLDDPGASHDEELELLRGLIGCDVSLVRWEGSGSALARHGWRSGAAALAGLMSADGDDTGRALVGRPVPLAPGRSLPRGRHALLSLETPTVVEDDRATAYLTLQLQGERDLATVQSEPSFRAPVGLWPVPALRVVKNIHRLLVEQAERFVFNTVDDTQAIALAIALQRSVRAYSGRGLLTGPDGEGPPDIRGGTVRNPENPGLYATVAAYLRPWSQSINIRVSLRPGAQPSLEVL